MLASIETYLLDVIARQRDMSKIATQSANDRLKLNFINRIYKFLYIKVGIYFLCECHCTRVSHNLLDNRLINTGFCQHRYTCMSAAVWCTINIKLFHKWMGVSVIIIPVLEVFAIRCMDKVLAFRIIFKPILVEM